MNFTGFVRFEKTIPFDRHAKSAPHYLNRLRNKGYWRMWEYLSRDLGQDSIYYRSAAFREAQFAPKGVFVDMGCGESADALIASYAGYKKCYKVDLFPLFTANEFAKRDAEKAEAKQGVKFIQGDVCERQPIRANSVDLVSCNAMVDLIPEEDRVLFYREAFRILKPGGQLSVSVVRLKNGYGTDSFIERDRCTQPGWGVGFELERNYQSGFIVQKPQTPREQTKVRANTKLSDKLAPKATSATPIKEERKDFKETHDLNISPMSPTFCGKCGLSGGELSRQPCPATLTKGDKS